MLVVDREASPNCPDGSERDRDDEEDPAEDAFAPADALPGVRVRRAGPARRALRRGFTLAEDEVGACART